MQQKSVLFLFYFYLLFVLLITIANSNTNERGMKMSKVQNVINKFGGVRPMSRATGIHPATISNWNRSGIITAKYQRTILDAANDGGIKLTADDVIC